MAEADLLNLPWIHTMPGNMLDAISWPNKFPNRHRRILIGCAYRVTTFGAAAEFD
jgi:hypothetical protein